MNGAAIRESGKPAAMADIEEDENGTVWLRVPLIGETRARLDGLARFTGDDPVAIAASLLHDVLEDDESAHVSPADVLTRRLH